MSIQVIIGNSTQATFPGASCIISANWGFEPGRTDAYCLGSWTPSLSHTIYKPTLTLSMTVYAGGATTYSTLPSTSCVDTNTIAAGVSPGYCGVGLGDVSGSWYVTSYSYSKEDKTQPAQESWSMTIWQGISSMLDPGEGQVVEPDHVLRTISTGQSTEATGTQTGIAFGTTFATSQTGSISANSVGKASVLTHGTVVSVGGSSNDAAFTGNASATIPYNPMYL